VTDTAGGVTLPTAVTEEDQLLAAALHRRLVALDLRDVYRPAHRRALTALAELEAPRPATSQAWWVERACASVHGRTTAELCRRCPVSPSCWDWITAFAWGEPPEVVERIEAAAAASGLDPATLAALPEPPRRQLAAAVNAVTEAARRRRAMAAAADLYNGAATVDAARFDAMARAVAEAVDRGAGR